MVRRVRLITGGSGLTWLSRPSTPTVIVVDFTPDHPYRRQNWFGSHRSMVLQRVTESGCLYTPQHWWLWGRHLRSLYFERTTGLGRVAFCCALRRWVRRGTEPTLDSQPLLMQHIFADAADFLLRCNASHSSSHEMPPTWPDAGGGRAKRSTFRDSSKQVVEVCASN